MIDVIIIGAGTAGLSAAIYVQRAGKKALILQTLKTIQVSNIFLVLILRQIYLTKQKT